MSILYSSARSMSRPVSKAPRVRWNVLVRNLSLVYLGLLGVVYLLLYQVSESWWFSSALTYVPRLPWLLPVLVLGGLAIRFHRRSLITNGIAALLVLGPIMDFNIPNLSASGTGQGTTLKVVTCNVQNFEPNFGQVLREVSRNNPDLIAFQDAHGNTEMLETYFADWHHVHHLEFWVGSKFPVKLLGICHVPSFDRDSAIAVEVQLPEQTIRLVSVHLMTPREGLTGLLPGHRGAGSGSVWMESLVALRDEEAALTRAFVMEMTQGHPHLVVGDLNMPTSSNLYHLNWGDYRSAFEEACWGYGYTFPTTGPSIWPTNVPWVRLDHMLLSEEWDVTRCQVGSGAGSDHRPLSATLVLPDDAK